MKPSFRLIRLRRTPGLCRRDVTGRREGGNRPSAVSGSASRANTRASSATRAAALGARAAVTEDLAGALGLDGHRAGAVDVEPLGSIGILQPACASQRDWGTTLVATTTIRRFESGGSGGGTS